jgi:hypothetical protein
MAGILDSIKGTIGSTLSGTTGGSVVNRTVARLFGAGLESGAQSPFGKYEQARWSSTDNKKDFRARLIIPSSSKLRNIFLKNNVLRPLDRMGGMVFPLTPTIIVQHTAHYNAMASVHNNYPFYAYQNSETSSFNVIGDFPVQNWEDAQHWVATLHFLRTVTKMFFGGANNDVYKGAPPPILKFSAYGDYVFSNVPTVVTNFSVELTNGVDYISTQHGRTSLLSQQAQGDGIDDIDIDTNSDNLTTSWAPTMSIFSLQLQPIYSRSSLGDFSLQKFANGNQDLNSNDPDGNGYSFI